MYALELLMQQVWMQENKARGLYKRAKLICSLNSVLYATTQSRKQGLTE